MLIRPLNVGDGPGIAAMLHLCGVFSREEILVAMEVFGDGVASADPGRYALFGADDGEELRGYICVGRVPMTASTWDLYWLCIRPEARRRGVGRSLVTHGEAYVAAHGGRRLAVQTSGRPDYGPVRAFYATMGFQLVGRIPDYFADHDDGVFYYRVLEPSGNRAVTAEGARLRARP